MWLLLILIVLAAPGVYIAARAWPWGKPAGMHLTCLTLMLLPPLGMILTADFLGPAPGYCLVRSTGGEFLVLLTLTFFLFGAIFRIALPPVREFLTGVLLALTPGVLAIAVQSMVTLAGCGA